MSAETRAANIVAPHQGDVCCFTLTTTDMVVTLSATALLGTLATKGQYISFCAEGADAHVFFNSTATISAKANTISGAATATKATAGWLLKDGVPQMFRLTRVPDSAGTNPGNFRTRMTYVGTAAAKKIWAYVSSYTSTDGIAR